LNHLKSSRNRFIESYKNLAEKGRGDRKKPPKERKREAKRHEAKNG